MKLTFKDIQHLISYIDEEVLGVMSDVKKLTDEDIIQELKWIHEALEVVKVNIDEHSIKVKSLSEMKEYHNECLECAEAFRYGVPCPDIDKECPYKKRGK